MCNKHICFDQQDSRKQFTAIFNEFGEEHIWSQVLPLQLLTVIKSHAMLKSSERNISLVPIPGHIKDHSVVCHCEIGDPYLSSVLIDPCVDEITVIVNIKMTWLSLRNSRVNIFFVKNCLIVFDRIA